MKAVAESKIGVDREVIVDRLRQVLLCAEVAFRGLDGGVTEEKLDLLQVAAGTRFRARTDEVNIT